MSDAGWAEMTPAEVEAERLDALSLARRFRDIAGGHFRSGDRETAGEWLEAAAEQDAVAAAAAAEQETRRALISAEEVCAALDAAAASSAAGARLAGSVAARLGVPSARLPGALRAPLAAVSQVEREMLFAAAAALTATVPPGTA